jgi:hypothetical protein
METSGLDLEFSCLNQTRRLTEWKSEGGGCAGYALQE